LPSVPLRLWREEQPLAVSSRTATTSDERKRVNT
jgi:hypothetical protein